MKFEYQVLTLCFEISSNTALDSESEKLVQEAFNKIMGVEHQTTLIIAHRLSTIRNADRIVVMADGAVEEIGSYDELMAKEGGRFRQLQALQDLGSPVLHTDKSRPAKKKKNKKQSSLASRQATDLQVEVNSLSEKKRKAREEAELEKEELQKIDKKKIESNASRARQLAKNDHQLFVIGGIGALLAGMSGFVLLGYCETYQAGTHHVQCFLHF